MISVKISATVYPTEDPEKVIKAVSDLFTGIELQKENVDTKEPEKGVSPFFFILQVREGLTSCIPCTDLFAGNKL